jgi:hypothetical protein
MGTLWRRDFIPPPWFPFGLSFAATSLAYIGAGGGQAATGPACLVGTMTVTLFGGLHYMVLREAAVRSGGITAPTPVIQQEPIEPVPEPPPKAPPGWKQMPKGDDNQSWYSSTIGRVELDTSTEPAYPQVQYLDIGWGVWVFAQNYQRIGKLTESDWDKAKVYPSLTHFRTVRDYLMVQRLAQWKNPHAHRTGWELTRLGGRVCEWLATATTPPLHKEIPFSP